MLGLRFTRIFNMGLLPALLFVAPMTDFYMPKARAIAHPQLESRTAEPAKRARLEVDVRILECIDPQHVGDGSGECASNKIVMSRFEKRDNLDELTGGLDHGIVDLRIIEAINVQFILDGFKKPALNEGNDFAMSRLEKRASLVGDMNGVLGPYVERRFLDGNFSLVLTLP